MWKWGTVAGLRQDHFFLVFLFLSRVLTRRHSAFTIRWSSFCVMGQLGTESIGGLFCVYFIPK